MKLVTVLLWSSVAGQALADPKACITIATDLDRLACYDKETGRTPAAVPVETAQKNWTVTSQKSALRDTTDVVVYSESKEDVNCGWNRGARVALVLRCVEDTTAAYFTTGCHMTSSRYDNYGEIEYRVDELKSRKINGDASTDNRSLGLWSGGKAIPFIKQLLEGKKLVARMMPYGESPFTAQFDIAGLDQAIKPLRDACKW